MLQVHVIDLSLPDEDAKAAILHACVTTGFFYGKSKLVVRKSADDSERA